MMTEGQSVDLTNCDREPIHTPGSIQSHGCLLVCDIGVDHVLRSSNNAAEILCFDAGETNSKKLSDIFGFEGAHTLRNLLAYSAGPRRPGLLPRFDFNDRCAQLSAAVHTYNGVVLLEFERASQESSGNPLEIARTIVSRLHDVECLDDLISLTPRLLRSHFGYDRVMIYEFSDDGSGKVVSEARRSGLESFLGQHFPASDIPNQARRLYTQNTIRVIGDVDDPSAPITPIFDEAGQPLDLSFSHLRSVSPIHIEYLRNMGVKASMSVSIMVGGKLWGLIACHHYGAKKLSMTERISTEMFSDVFALKLEAFHHRDELMYARRARKALDDLLRDITDKKDIFEFLGKHLDAFSKMAPCDGLGLLAEGKWVSYNGAPPEKIAMDIAETAGRLAGSQVWASHNLCSVTQSARAHLDTAAGVLIVPLSQTPRDFLMFFRKEQLQTVNWAGDPNKTYSVGPQGDRLTPRKSFAIWEQQVHEQSRPWSVEDKAIAETIRIQFLEIILSRNEQLDQERHRASLRQKMLHNELNHRVKNILSLIQSIVAQPVEAGLDVAAYVRTLKRRIQALSFAHDQVKRGEGGGSLENLLHAELSPYWSVASDISLHGPKLLLDGRAFSVLALVIHEVTTNAAKYGALSTPAGHLSVRWSINDSEDCEIEWLERGGPEVKPPKRRGFGSILLERSLPFDLGGKAEIDYAPEGLSARFIVPKRFVRTMNETPTPESTFLTTDIQATPQLLENKRILLVEDHLVIALEAENLLAELGVAEVVTASTVDEALNILERQNFDGAVLDFSLGPQSSVPIAERLLLRKTPFVFATGYADGGAIPSSFDGVPIVPKPYNTQSLTKGLCSAMAVSLENEDKL